MTDNLLEDVYSLLTKMSDSEFANAASGEFCEDLKAMIEGAIGRTADRIEAQAAEIERLRKAGTKMAGYAGHDDDCQIMLKGVWGDKTPCDCGYEDAWKALRDALGETE